MTEADRDTDERFAKAQGKREDYGGNHKRDWKDW